MGDIFYYAYKSRDGKVYCIGEPLTPWTATGDYLLFDTPEECVNYWARQGIEADRYA